MTTLQFPSIEFPALPNVSMAIPENWREAYPPGSYLAGVENAPDGYFASNVIVSITRHSVEYDIAQAVIEVQSVATQLPDGTAEEAFTTQLSGRNFIGCNVAYRDPAAGTLVQVHLFGAVDRGPVRDVIHLTGTCSADRVPDGYREIQTIVGGTVISEAITS